MFDNAEVILPGSVEATGPDLISVSNRQAYSNTAAWNFMLPLSDIALSFLLIPEAKTNLQISNFVNIKCILNIPFVVFIIKRYICIDNQSVFQSQCLSGHSASCRIFLFPLFTSVSSCLARFVYLVDMCANAVWVLLYLTLYVRIILLFLSLWSSL